MPPEPRAPGLDPGSGSRDRTRLSGGYFALLRRERVHFHARPEGSAAADLRQKVRVRVSTQPAGEPRRERLHLYII